MTGRRRQPSELIDRASPNDLVMLAIDAGGPVPQHLGAILVLNPASGFDLTLAQRLVADRVRAIPRLRQRLIRVPPGCGRRIWVDDPSFDPARHVRQLRCPAPGDEQALLDLAATVATDPLPPERPLWQALFVTDLADDRVGLILVLHHVLADGIGGLEILHSLVDQAPAHPARAFPQPPPSTARLAVDALRSRLRALSRVPAVARQLPRSLAAAGGVHAPPAARCSLLRRTGPRRRLAVVRADLDSLHDAARQHGGTVNDAVLTAVTGALHTLLARRGETVDTFRVTIPVAVHRSGHTLGNEAALLVVGLPGAGDTTTRLRRISATVRAARVTAGGPLLAGLLGPVFRALAALGVYRLYLNHQHRFHTLVSNVRGPDQPLTLAGAPIEATIPLSVAESGNVTVNFVALSYAGTLTIAAVADPDHAFDLPVLTAALQAELDAQIPAHPAGFDR